MWRAVPLISRDGDTGPGWADAGGMMGVTGNEGDESMDEDAGEGLDEGMPARVHHIEHGQGITSLILKGWSQ